MTTYYHGGVAGLRPGDLIHPAPPHVVDGCPICVARAEGRNLTVGEYRAWLREQGPKAAPALAALADAEDWQSMDPPSQRRAVYLTTDLAYAQFYAAKAGHGDLYEVVPDGLLPGEDPACLLDPLDPSTEDHFPTWTCTAARVVSVVARRVHLVRRDRRELLRRWKKADEQAAKAKALAEGEATLAKLDALRDRVEAVITLTGRAPRLVTE